MCLEDSLAFPKISWFYWESERKKERKYFKIKKKALLKSLIFISFGRNITAIIKSLTNTALISVKGDRKKTSKERSKLKIKCVISLVSSWRISEAVFSSRTTGKI